MIHLNCRIARSSMGDRGKGSRRFGEVYIFEYFAIVQILLIIVVVSTVAIRHGDLGSRVDRQQSQYRSRFPKSPRKHFRMKKTRKVMKRGQGRSSRKTVRQTPRDLLSASIPLVNPLAIWEEPTCAARHTGGEIGVRPRGGRSQSLRAGASLPPSPLFSRRRCHKVTRSLGSAGFTRAGVRTFDRSVGRLVVVSHRPGNTLPIDDRATVTAEHNKIHVTHRIRTRYCVTSLDFSSRLDIRSLKKLRETL